MKMNKYNIYEVTEERALFSALFCGYFFASSVEEAIREAEERLNMHQIIGDLVARPAETRVMRVVFRGRVRHMHVPDADADALAEFFADRLGIDRGSVSTAPAWGAREIPHPFLRWKITVSGETVGYFEEIVPRRVEDMRFSVAPRTDGADVASGLTVDEAVEEALRVVGAEYARDIREWAEMNAPTMAVGDRVIIACGHTQVVIIREESPLTNRLLTRMAGAAAAAICDAIDPPEEPDDGEDEDNDGDLPPHLVALLEAAESVAWLRDPVVATVDGAPVEEAMLEVITAIIPYYRPCSTEMLPASIHGGKVGRSVLSNSGRAAMVTAALNIIRQAEEARK